MGFGGHFYDPATGNITANEPKILEALNWDLGLAKEFDLEKVNNFVAGFSGEGNDPFMLGKLAMTIEGCWSVTFFEKAGITLDYGVGPVPAGDPSLPQTNEVETNPIVVMKSTKHPDQAFEFAWFASNADVSRSLPGWFQSPQVKAAMVISVPGRKPWYH
jgi:multiple sugar transport system substrate-binding protein